MIFHNDNREVTETIGRHVARPRPGITKTCNLLVRIDRTQRFFDRSKETREETRREHLSELRTLLGLRPFGFIWIYSWAFGLANLYVFRCRPESYERIGERNNRAELRMKANSEPT